MGDEDAPIVPPAPEKRKRGRPRKVPLNPDLHGPEFGKAKDFTVPPADFTCEGCGQAKASSAFSRYLELVAEATIDADDWEVPRLCDHCGTYGPPLENPLAKLSPREVEALSVLAAGGSMRRAALVLGVDEKQMRSYLSGREKPVIRAAYQKLCIQIGITPQLLAQKIFEALSASKENFDKDGKFMGSTPDHNVRLKAVAMAQKVLQIEQPAELSRRTDEDGSFPYGVTTNLGDGKTIDEEGYALNWNLPKQIKQVN